MLTCEVIVRASDREKAVQGRGKIGELPRNLDERLLRRPLDRRAVWWIQQRRLRSGFEQTNGSFFFSGGLRPREDPLTRSLAGPPTPHAVRAAHSRSLVRDTSGELRPRPSTSSGRPELCRGARTPLRAHSRGPQRPTPFARGSLALARSRRSNTIRSRRHRARRRFSRSGRVARRARPPFGAGVSSTDAANVTGHPVWLVTVSRVTPGCRLGDLEFVRLGMRPHRAEIAQTRRTGPAVRNTEGLSLTSRAAVAERREERELVHERPWQVAHHDEDLVAAGPDLRRPAAARQPDLRPRVIADEPCC